MSLMCLITKVVFPCRSKATYSRSVASSLVQTPMMQAARCHSIRSEVAVKTVF